MLEDGKPGYRDESQSCVSIDAVTTLPQSTGGTMPMISYAMETSLIFVLLPQ